MTKRFNPAQLKKRYASERRFKFISYAAVLLTSAFVFMLLIDIFYKAIPTLTEKTVTLEITVEKEVQTALNTALLAHFPDAKSRSERNKLLTLLSQGAGDELEAEIVKNPSLIGQKIAVKALLSSNADLYLKNSLVKVTREKIFVPRTLNAEENKAFIRIKPPHYELVTQSQILNIHDTLVTLYSSEQNRKINDKQALWLEILNDKKLINTNFNSRFFLKSDSREPELAGIRGALTGTILTVLLTLAICLPLGVAAAIYLQEFAAKNKYTDILEVNINNLAAVPSIVFGLLGLAVFLNAFNLPRSAPLVGGLVLALMVLPTIIIASRSAIAAVPPSIKQAALGVGASEQQAIFHHVLPLALPGIMTGTIIGVARAIGETAPLLMIGMVAFIIDIPTKLTDAATVLPVQIYLWSDLPEAGFVSRTATAIALLLLVLLALNLLAVILRNKYERRW